MFIGAMFGMITLSLGISIGESMVVGFWGTMLGMILGFIGLTFWAVVPLGLERIGLIGFDRDG